MDNCSVRTVFIIQQLSTPFLNTLPSPPISALHHPPLYPCPPLYIFDVAQLMIMGKENTRRLPRALKRLNLKPPTFNMWEKLWPELQPVPPKSFRGDQGIKKGYFAVYVGEDAKRYVIPLNYLKHPVFLQLLKKAEEEFGFCSGSTGLQIPCEPEDFDRLLLFIRGEHDALHGSNMEELLNLLTKPREDC